MAFNITYVTTAGTSLPDSPINLLPNNTTLSQRVRIGEPTKTILLIDKIEAALLLLANFIWEQETAIPGFFDFENSQEQQSQAETDLQQTRLQLFDTLKKIITNKNERSHIAAILLAIASSKREGDQFLIPLASDSPHDYSTITDEQIAAFIQSVVVNQLAIVIKLV